MAAHVSLLCCQSTRCFDANPRQPGRAAGAARLLGPAPKVHNGCMFDWNDLKYFLAVARHGSTIAAGKALGTSQSTVHRRLEELERRIGPPPGVGQPGGRPPPPIRHHHLSPSPRGGATTCALPPPRADAPEG